MLASSDPVNFFLMLSWCVSCFAAALLAIYAYVRWRMNPHESLSMAIAQFARKNSDRFLFGFLAAGMLFFALGNVSGMFIGHWLWPVEIEVPVVEPTTAEQLTAMRRIQQFVNDHPEFTIEELDALTPERLAELYPEIE